MTVLRTTSLPDDDATGRNSLPGTNVQRPSDEHRLGYDAIRLAVARSSTVFPPLGEEGTVSGCIGSPPCCRVRARGLFVLWLGKVGAGSTSTETPGQVSLPIRDGQSGNIWCLRRSESWQPIGWCSEDAARRRSALPTWTTAGRGGDRHAAPRWNPANHSLGGAAPRRPDAGMHKTAGSRVTVGRRRIGPEFAGSPAVAGQRSEARRRSRGNPTLTGRGFGRRQVSLARSGSHQMIS